MPDLYDISSLNISGNTENDYQRFWKFLLTEVILCPVPYIILVELTRRITVSGGVVISSKKYLFSYYVITWNTKILDAELT